MKKNFFNLLAETNIADEENKTENLSVGFTLVAANKTKRGTEVIMGAADNVVMDLMNGDLIPILLLLKKDEFEKIKNQLK